MVAKVMKEFFMMMALTMVSACIYSQNNVPFGIHYQAVARNSSGTELTNTKISVRFSVISGDPLGTLVYQELHQDIITSKFGVFSLVIGHGVPSSSSPVSSISEVSWKDANHYLKVEVKFENEFMDMGTMQFLTVPYAFYAQKSLEPGPAGSKGDRGDKGEQGDPASDNQTLSVVNVEGSDYLAISGGNQVKISTIEKDGDPTNEIQDIIINSDKLKITRNPSATEWDLSKYLDNTDKQNLTWNSVTRVLGISGNAGTIDLSELKNDADADPANEIQDLQISNDKLSITGKTGAAQIDLSTYRDNTDNQTLSYSESDNKLTITGGNTIQMGTMVAFRAKKLISVIASSLSDVIFIPTSVEFNDGNAFNGTTGEFIAPTTGIYTFNVTYYADGSGGSRKLSIFYNSALYEDMAIEIGSGVQITVKSITMKLSANDIVKLVINTGTATQTGTGSFSGFKVY
jgi:C1q domain.